MISRKMLFGKGKIIDKKDRMMSKTELIRVSTPLNRNCMLLLHGYFLLAKIRDELLKE